MLVAIFYKAWHHTLSDRDVIT